MESLVTRLENAVARLEKFEGFLTSRVAPSRATTYAQPQTAAVTAPATVKPQSTQCAPSVASTGSSLGDYDQLLADYLQPLTTASAPLGAEVAKAIGHLEKAFHETRRVLDVSNRSKKPDSQGLQQLVQPVAEQLMAASALAEGRRTAAFNHLKTLAECLQGLSWLVYSGPGCGMSPPPQFVAESWQSAEFFANKIMMEFRSKDEAQVAWVKAIKELMNNLEVFVRRHYAAGLKWNPDGLPLQQALAAPSAAAPALAAPAAPKLSPPAPPAPAAPAPKPAARGPPPPPPPGPPPPALSLNELRDQGATAKPASAMSALFNEISKGEGITAGLRKVTDDMKTKNRADRTGMVSVPSDRPSTAAPAAAAAGPRGGAKVAGPSRFEYQGDRKKWVVENQVSNRNIVISETAPNQSVYIFGCRDSVVQVQGKVNAISVDGCSKTGVVFDQVIASCEVVNCQGMQLQCTTFVPTMSVEKSDGCQLYLPTKVAASPDFQIVTAKCSEVNVIVVGDFQTEDPVELPIPEQFISSFKDGKLVTVAAAHSGA